MAALHSKFISAPPSTDIWRKPPATDVFNAPSVTLASGPLSSFKSAQVSFIAPWEYRYDQGGLLLHLTKPDAKDKWLKTGIEFYNDKPFMSTVGCDNWADWSIVPTAGNETEYTVQARRESDELGVSLWVYRLILDEKDNEVERIPLREVPWFFADEAGWSIAVGPYAARPADANVTEGEQLKLKYWDLAVVI
ncbi:hypothetical protein BDZ89DRAFT_977822 [Hymenopellis radicata]|nr:hypothetical protein BDZ89DRAFT_977822 [Hymenopellis radicata]